MESYFSEYTVRGEVKRYMEFSKLTEGSAYLIGYLACDGSYVSGKSNRNYSFMSVNSKDKYILDEFKETYCPDASLYFLGKKSSERVTAKSDVWELRFPAKMNETFNKFGVFDYKPSRRIVGVPNLCFLSYLAGCIDSDGFISVTHRNDCRTPRLRFFITHGSEKFLADLQTRLDTFGVSTTLRQHGPNVFRLQAQNTEHNCRILYRTYNYLKNKDKKRILLDYLHDYYFVPQASDELLESVSRSAA